MGVPPRLGADGSAVRHGDCDEVLARLIACMRPSRRGLLETHALRNGRDGTNLARRSATRGLRRGSCATDRVYDVPARDARLDGFVATQSTSSARRQIQCGRWWLRSVTCVQVNRTRPTSSTLSITSHSAGDSTVQGPAASFARMTSRRRI